MTGDILPTNITIDHDTVSAGAFHTVNTDVSPTFDPNASHLNGEERDQDQKPDPIREVEDALRGVRQKMQSITDENIQLRQTTDALSQDNTHLRAQVDTLTATNTQLGTQIAKFESVRRSYESKIEELGSHIMELEIAGNKDSRQISQLIEEKNRLQEEIGRLHQDVERVKQEQVQTERASISSRQERDLMPETPGYYLRDLGVAEFLIPYILGMSREQILDYVKQIYKAEMLKYHPDKVGLLPEPVRQLLTSKSGVVNRAYQWLEKYLAPKA